MQTAAFIFFVVKMLRRSCCASDLKSKNGPQFQMPKNKAPPCEVEFREGPSPSLNECHLSIIAFSIPFSNVPKTL